MASKSSPSGESDGRGSGSTSLNQQEIPRKTTAIRERRENGYDCKMDMSQILEENQQDEVEYIRGRGRVVHARPRVEAQPRARPMESRSDKLASFMDQNRHYTGGIFSWNRETDRFLFISTNNELVSFDASTINRIDYIIRGARFVFNVDRDKAGPPLFMIVLEHTEVAYVMRFRSCLLSRIVPFREHWEDKAIDVLHDQLQRCMNQKQAGEAQRDKSPAVGIVQASRMQAQRDSSLSVKRQQQSTKSQELVKKTSPPAAVTRECVLSDLDEPPSTNGQESPVQEGVSSISLDPPGTDRSVDGKQPSFQPGNIVFRFRKRSKLDNLEDKLNKEDIYDGPFVIVAVDNNRRASSRATSSTTKVGLKYEPHVQLRFHKDSVANSWVPQKRVRQALAVPAECSDDMSKTAKWRAATAAAAADVDHQSDIPSGTTLISKLGPSHFVIGEVVPPDPVGDRLYEVDRLRAKRVVIRTRRQCPNEPADDQDVQKFLEENGPLAPGTVAVLEYRVHWSGWPSEDDTWERAHDNIPQDDIDRFNATRDQPKKIYKTY